MGKRKFNAISIGFAVLILLTVALLGANSLRRSSHIVLPAPAGSLTLQKQYKYGKVLLWKYTKPMQQEGEAL